MFLEDWNNGTGAIRQLPDDEVNNGVTSNFLHPCLPCLPAGRHHWLRRGSILTQKVKY